MNYDLKNRRVLVAISGGIAVYKVVEAVRRLIKRGAEVRVIMTHSATRFVHPTTFAAITGYPVGLELFSEEGRPGINHLEYPHWADIILVAPATGNIIAKMATGIADDLVSSSMLAARCPVLFAPAMNTAMYENPATQMNIETLCRRGMTKVGPGVGAMAAPDEKPGEGRMVEPQALEEAVAGVLLRSKRLLGKKVVVTTGRTEESIDDVRILTNRSSGKMGVEIARRAAEEGADVVLIRGAMDVPEPDGMCIIKATSGLEMLEAAKLEVHDADLVFYVAAVSDWRPKNAFSGKMKRETMDGPPTIEFVENPDIAKETAKMAKGVAIGFALEVKAERALAVGKMELKGFNAILLNTAETIGSSKAKLTWIDPVEEMEKVGSKEDLAVWIVETASKKFVRE